MRVHLVNPSHVSFGVGVITPRWLFVLAAATPARFGAPNIVDETLEVLDPAVVQPGDVVGIGIHTGNALRGYEVGRMVRERGATVIFGGIHTTLYPEEPPELGAAHAVVKGDGDVAWGQALDDFSAGRLQLVYEGGRVDASDFKAARWDLLPDGSYMWASVQTIRGCPKHCSFCSVWRTDGQQPRQRHHRRRHRRDRRAAAHGLPLHRPRRRQLLSRSRRKICGWPGAGRTSRACTSSRRSAPSASS